MTPADVRLTAQLVAAGRVHCVTDESVMALARRVLELEPIADVEAKRLLRMAGERNTWMDRAERAEADLTDAIVAKDIARAEVAAERETCARMAESWSPGQYQLAAAIRARGVK